MDLHEGMSQLSQKYKGKDWFNDIGTDNLGRCVVYINYTCHETLRDIPDQIAGKQVVVHFATSRDISKDKFVTRPQAISIPLYVPLADMIKLPPEEDESEDKSLRHLTDELDRMEKICGTNTLGEIFFEIHDKSNAVTNLSARYPEVSRVMQKLYDDYGFDVLYEEIEL
jgi:hypothetical protein